MAKKNDVLPTSQGAPHKPKGMIDALSEIQQYGSIEKRGSNIPDDFLTIGGKFSFFGVGFHSAVMSGVISIFLTPLSIGVFDRYIPIFGSYDINIIDKIFSMFIAVGFTLGYGIFLAQLRKHNTGSITKSAINNLMGGIVAGSVVKIVFSFLLFHILYFIVFAPPFLVKMLLKIGPFMKKDTKLMLFDFFVDFRAVFLTSAYFILFTTLLLIGIPSFYIWRGGKKSKEIMDNEARWK